MSDRKNMFRVMLSASTALIACTSSNGALAQSNDSQGASQAEAQAAAEDDSTNMSRSDANFGGEIVVTATRQEQGLSKVPISVVALDQRSLTESGARSTDDLARLAPGLTLTTDAAGSGTNKNIAIRGVSSTVGAATTGIYIDDTPIQTRRLSNATTNAYPQLFDLERVEVLRGPQGTLFGAGAEGGVVRFITPQPSLTEFSGHSRAEVGLVESGSTTYEVGAAVGGPIVMDTLGFRISGVYRHDGGYVDRVDRFTGNVIAENENVDDSFSLRGALLFEPTEWLSITPSIMYQETDAPGSPVYFESVSLPEADRFINQFATKQLRDDRFILPTLTVKADLGFADLVSTTSYFDRKALIRADTTFFIPSVLFRSPLLYGPGEFGYSTIRDRQRNWTQEVRLQSFGDSRLNWTIGAFYQHAKQSGNQVNFDPFLDDLAVRLTGATIEQLTGVALVNGTEVFRTDIDSTDEQIAGFGEASYEIVDDLKLTAGVRIASSKVDLARQSFGPANGGDSGFSATQKETPITPRFGISYQVTPETLLYASASKGFRVGGVNAPVIALCESVLNDSGLTVTQAYDSDSVWSYEVGAKSRSSDGRLAISASAFQIDWNNIQSRVQLAACGSGFTTNFGKARSRGFDLAVDLRPLEGLTLNLGLGYVDAKLTETVIAGTALLGADGDKIPGISPWAVTASARYQAPLFGDTDAYLRVDYQYNDSTPDPNLTISGTDPLAMGNNAFNNVSMRGGLNFGNYDISVFVNNLLNEHPTIGRGRDTTAADFFFATTTRPRVVGVTGSMRF